MKNFDYGGSAAFHSIDERIRAYNGKMHASNPTKNSNDVITKQDDDAIYRDMFKRWTHSIMPAIIDTSAKQGTCNICSTDVTNDVGVLKIWEGLSDEKTLCSSCAKQMHAAFMKM